MTSLTLWLVLAVAIWLMEVTPVLYVLVHVGAIWLIRSLYFYSSIVPALMDLGLNGLSAATAFWAISHTGSSFLAIWCFFLVQALFVAIPPALTPGGKREPGKHLDTDNFERARRRAEAAVRQLFAQ